jgi:hypothetical protein
MYWKNYRLSRATMHYQSRKPSKTDCGTNEQKTSLYIFTKERCSFAALSRQLQCKMHVGACGIRPCEKAFFWKSERIHAVLAILVVVCFQ